MCGHSKSMRGFLITAQGTKLINITISLQCSLVKQFIEAILRTENYTLSPEHFYLAFKKLRIKLEILIILRLQISYLTKNYFTG